jgi:hypothetical protein
MTALAGSRGKIFLTVGCFAAGLALAAAAIPSVRKAVRNAMGPRDPGLRKLRRSQRALDEIDSEIFVVEREINTMVLKMEKTSSLEELGRVNLRLASILADLEAAQDFLDALRGSEDMKIIRREQNKRCAELADRVEGVVDSFNNYKRKTGQS